MRPLVNKFSINREKSESYLYIQKPELSNGLYYLTSFGHEFWNDDYYLNRSNYNIYMINYVLSGKVGITINGKEHILNKGDLIFLNLNQPNILRAVESPEIYFFHFLGSDCPALYSQFLQNDKNIIRNINEEEMKSIFETFKEEMLSHNTNYYKISSSLYGLLMSLLNKVSTTKYKVFSSFVKQIIAYIITTYPVVTPKQVADKFGYNLTYIERIFKKQCNQTLTDYILIKKYDIACQLLICSDLSVAEISNELGYSTTQGLIKLFKRNGNTTPLLYKKEHRL